MTDLKQKKKFKQNKQTSAPSESNNHESQPKPIFKDSRFNSVHYDPRFAPITKKQKKFQADSRFSKMFNDPRFKVISKVDKYGRKVDIPERNTELEDMYYVDNQNEEAEKGDKNSEKTDSEQEDKEFEEALAEIRENKLQKVKKVKAQKFREDETEKPKKKNKNQLKEDQNPKDKHNPAHFDENGKFQWNVESSSESEIKEEELDELMKDAEAWNSEEEDEKIPQAKPSKRMALMNYDWENMHASDIMLFLTSFAPKEGFISKVTVYPSDFGIERMKKEQTEGPTDIWKGEQKPKTQEDISTLEKSIVDADVPWIYRENQNSDIDPIKLRRYEKDRLKYYYAVVECDSIGTAKQIYEACDGLEFELTSIKVDLRYIPNALKKFPHAPKEVCTEIPPESKVHNFLNRAIHHTNVKLSWEEPQEDRFKELYKKLNDKKLDKMDIHQYLSSDGEGESEDEEMIELKRKALLEGVETVDWKKDFDKGRRKKEREMEMVIKFNPGFDDLGNKILEKNNPEKPKPEKKKYKTNKEDNFFVEEKGEEEEEVKRDEKKYKQELELLVDEENAEQRGFKVNFSDDRFANAFEKSTYAIDPTSKYFNSKNNSKILQEQLDRRRKKVKVN